MATSADRAQETWIPTYCYQCNSGPDLLRVKRVGGVAVTVDGNPSFADDHPAEAMVCLKALALIQKHYNPHRVKAPLKRTNPKKGRNEAPGWVEIGWDEALDLVAEKLSETRSKGLVNESGTPRLAITRGEAGTSLAYVGTLGAFLTAWGPFDRSLSPGGTIRCYHTEHLCGELWHRAFTCAPDMPLCNYVLSFGNNSNASSGVTGIRRYADGRARGTRHVQVEPHLSVTGATADEWIPIRPKTDDAFLYALIHVVLHELKTWDADFLKTLTNSPYLVGPDGSYVRDPDSAKPLIWDAVHNQAKTFDAPDIGDFALLGAFSVNGVQARPAFELLQEHVRSCTPEWAAAITTVDARTIRRVASEFVSSAMIGATIEVEGTRMPYRPVCVVLGRSVTNGLGSFEAEWGAHVLQILVGGLEVPGGHLGTNVQIGGVMGRSPDGLIDFPMGPTDAENWPWPPAFRDGSMSLVPSLGTKNLFRTPGPYHLAWMNLGDRSQESWLDSQPPDIWIVYRCNPALSLSNTDAVLAAMARIPFQVSFAYVLDETTDFADVVLPESGDLESLQLFRVGGTRPSWNKIGFAIRQPVAEPPHNTRDMTNIATDLAERLGILDEYNEVINAGAVLGFPLKTPSFDHRLERGRRYSVEEIVDRFCRAASQILSKGEEEHGLEWFKENGAYLATSSKLEGRVSGPIFLRPWYLHKMVVDMGLRYELPYQERLKRVGDELAERLHSKGHHWWDEQLRGYQYMPRWEDVRAKWDTGSEYDLWLTTTRSMQFAWGANVGVPFLDEAASLVLGQSGFSINSATARARGIKNGDEIWVESPLGRIKGKAVVREGVHPEVVVEAHMFGHWRTPVAKDLGWPNMNPITPLSNKLTEWGGGISDHVRVKVYKVVKGAAYGSSA